MKNGQQSASIFQFGVYELSERTGELRKGGTVVHLPRQPARILILLAEHTGEIVTREEIQQKTWTKDVTVDFEVGLNRCIRQIRSALLDDADVPRYIETIPRVGYRFIAPVTIAGRSAERTRAGVVGVYVAEPAPVAEPPEKSLPRNRSRIWALTGMLCLAIAGAAGFFFARSGSSTKDKLRPDYAVIPLTTELGFVVSPTFSPDGSQLAFSWNGKKQENFDIYVQVVGSYEALRLTDTPEIEFSPSWSPDGRLIAFCRGAENGRTSIWTMSPLGGAAKKVTDLSWPAAFDARNVAWSRDSRRLAYADRAQNGGQTNGLFEINLEDGSIRQITSPLGGDTDMEPAYSPDGHSLAFVRDVGRGLSHVYVLPLRDDGTAAEEPRLLQWPGFEHVYSGRPVWTLDSRQIIFASNRTSEQQLWIGNADGSSKPELLPLTSNLVDSALSSNGRLALVHERYDTDLWRLNLDRLGPGASSALEPVANSTRLELNPKISPDGTKIAFESNLSGFTEIWTSTSMDRILCHLRP